MYNLYTKFIKVLEICKQFSEKLVNELGNVPRCGPVPKFSDLEVVALFLTAGQRALIARSGYSTINCKSTRVTFPISYQGDNSMTVERKQLACVRNFARG